MLFVRLDAQRSALNPYLLLLTPSVTTAGERMVQIHQTCLKKREGIEQISQSLSLPWCLDRLISQDPVGKGTRHGKEYTKQVPIYHSASALGPGTALLFNRCRALAFKSGNLYRPSNPGYDQRKSYLRFPTLDMFTCVSQS
jgi:hypothetical protein